QASLPNPSSVLHEEVEGLIQKSGVEWTFLRPGMLASNALAWWAPQIRTGDVVRWPYLAAPTAPIDERDVASVAVRALLGDGHARAEYVLTGPQSLSQLEQVSTIGRSIGRSLYMACARCRHVAEIVGGGNRPTCIRDPHGRGGHRDLGPNIFRLGQRSCAGVSPVKRFSRCLKRCYTIPPIAVTAIVRKLLNQKVIGGPDDFEGGFCAT